MDAGRNIVIVSCLSDGPLWDHRVFPDTAILEICPREKLKQTGGEGKSDGLLGFISAHIGTWRQQDYEDTMLAIERIRKPLKARQVLTRSGAVSQKSLEKTEEADLTLRNVTARIK